MFLAVCILLIAGVASAVYWPQLSALVAKPSEVAEAKSDPNGDSGKPPPDAVVKGPPPTVKPPKDNPSKPPDKPVVTPKPPDMPPQTNPVKPLPVKPVDPPVKPPVKPIEQPPVKPPVTPSNPPVVQAMTFPRRALAVSVNNYLFANPVNFGSGGRGGRNVHALLEKLNTGLRFPTDQMMLLSDAAPSGTARPPLKPVIEKTVNDFLATSRDQDRLLLMFIGHAVEIEDEPYLVPIEGDLEVKETLIPVKWLLSKLGSCRARQKVLVLDVCRLNPSRGQERPGSGPMSAKLDALLKQPPPGVQVWSACVAEQHSYEFEYIALNNGVFQDALFEILSQGMPGGMQKAEDTIPVAQLVERVNQRMKEVLDKEQKVQTSRLTGEEPAAGAPYDSSQPVPPRVIIEVPAPPEGGAAPVDLVQGVLKDLEVPSIKTTRDEQALKVEQLPVFAAKLMEAYKDDGQKSPFRDTVVRAREVLNQQLKGKRLREEFRAPPNEARFKDEIKDYQTREVAALLGELNEALEDLKNAGKDRDKEMSKRWQANYDYVLARLEMQIAYLYEYTTMLGSMRKDLPARDPKIHGGWRLASQTTLQGDAAGKRLATDARKILEKLAKDHPDTPWAVLAKRERFTALGLDFQPIK